MAAKLNPSKTLSAKRRLHAHGQSLVFARGNTEREEHVAGKALLWALYLPQYPDLAVEVGVGDHYKPDVVSLDATGVPIFWGESGVTSEKKITRLAKHYRATHFALARWYGSLDMHVAQVSAALEGVSRTAPYDVIVFPADAARFINEEGEIIVTFDDVQWTQLMPEPERYRPRKR